MAQKPRISEGAVIQSSDSARMGCAECAIPPGEAVIGIRAGLNGLRANDTGSIGIAYSLLDYAFPNCQRYSGKLSGLQYDVLELMVESDQIWYWGNVILILRSFGLADRRENLRQMLGVNK